MKNKLSVGYIGKFECDFIARANYNDYYYIQVSKDISNKDNILIKLRTVNLIQKTKAVILKY